MVNGVEENIFQTILNTLYTYMHSQTINYKRVVTLWVSKYSKVKSNKRNKLRANLDIEFPLMCIKLLKNHDKDQIFNLIYETEASNWYQIGK